tara:strand:- start:2680 stop:2943 length:264 start_codon:yes stop_codon:yes gene_type:complete
MSRKQRHIKSQINIINYEGSYAIQKPRTATFISEKTMETNEEKEGVRQTSKTVHDKSGLAQSEEAKGQTETTCFVKIMESKTVGLFA